MPLHAAGRHRSLRLYSSLIFEVSSSEIAFTCLGQQRRTMGVAIAAGCTLSSPSSLENRSCGRSPSGIWAHQSAARNGDDTLGVEFVQGFTAASPSPFEQQNEIGVSGHP